MYVDRTEKEEGRRNGKSNKLRLRSVMVVNLNVLKPPWRRRIVLAITKSLIRSPCLVNIGHRHHQEIFSMIFVHPFTRSFTRSIIFREYVWWFYPSVCTVCVCVRACVRAKRERFLFFPPLFLLLVQLVNPRTLSERQHFNPNIFRSSTSYFQT